MRPIPVALASLILVVMAGAAGAATAPPAGPPAAKAAAQAPTVFPPPRFLSGFSHPDLTACQTLSPAQRVCIVPANVGGSYVIETAGFANSTGTDSVLAMSIGVGNHVCVTETGTKFTGRGYLHMICETTLATDRPIQIVVNVQARNATLDPTGPVVLIRNQVWDGVVSVRGGEGGPLPTAAPAPAKPPAAAKPGH